MARAPKTEPNRSRSKGAKKAAPKTLARRAASKAVQQAVATKKKAAGRARVDQVALRKEAVLVARRAGSTWREIAEAGLAGQATLSSYLEDDAFARRFEEASAGAIRRLADVLEECAQKALDDPSYQRSLIFYLQNNGWAERVNVEHRGRVHYELAGQSSDALERGCQEAIRRYTEAGGGKPD